MNPDRLGAWVPILQQYGTSLLQRCVDAEELSRRLAQQWLDEYMLAGNPQATALAQEASAFFADYDQHLAHSLGIDRDQLRARGLVVDDLEDDQELQDAVLSVHHAALHTFVGTPAVKVIENHRGRAFIVAVAPAPPPLRPEIGPADGAGGVKPPFVA